MVEEYEFGEAARHHDHDAFLGVLAAVAHLVAFREAHRDAEGAAARDNRNLVERVRVLAQERHEGVARFVVGRVALLFVGHQERAALGTHAELVAGFLEVEHRDLLVVEPRGEEGRLVHEVLEVGTCESRRALRDGGYVHVLVERNLALLQVHLQNFFAALQVGQSHHDLAVEAARTQERLVEHVGAVGGCNQDDAFVCSEAVHLHEQLVQCLFAFIVPASEACATLAAHRVDFVDEQNARSVLLARFKKVAHAACTYAHEHLHEVGTRHAEERHSRFAGDGASEKRLAGTRRPDEQGSLRDASTEFVILFRGLEEFHEFLQVLLSLVATRHVVEGSLLLRVGAEDFRLALAETERVLAGATHLAARHDPEERDEEDDREECHDGVDPRCRFVDDLHLHALEHFPCGNLFVRNFEHVA